MTTDKGLVLYPEMKNVFGNKARYRGSQYINNRIERDHRAIKSRLKMMKGFKNIFSVLKFCTIYKEIRQFFCMKDSTCSEYFGVIMFKIQDFSNLAVLAV